VIAAQCTCGLEIGIASQGADRPCSMPWLAAAAGELSAPAGCATLPLVGSSFLSGLLPSSRSPSTSNRPLARGGRARRANAPWRQVVLANAALLRRSSSLPRHQPSPRLAAPRVTTAISQAMASPSTTSSLWVDSGRRGRPRLHSHRQLDSRGKPSRSVASPAANVCPNRETFGRVGATMRRAEASAGSTASLRAPS